MLKTRWPAVPIEDLCARVTSGGTPSRSNPAYYDGGTIPWIKTGELRGWYVDDIAERITPAAVRESSAKIFPPETVLLAMYGDGKTMGSVGLIRTPAATNQACCAMLADPQECDPKFLMYSLVYFKPAILKLAISGAQRNLNGKSIKQFPIGAPPVEVQQRIASILSAYDNLIENNTRRIAILEEMARRIYEEWFVRFRFPGHEGVRMVESELGLVPEGWRRETLADCAIVTMGQSPSFEFYNSEGNGLPFHQGVTNFGRHFPTHKMFCSSEGRLAEEGDILVSVRAPVGRINLSPSRLVIGRGLCAVRSRKGQQVFLLHRLFETFQEEDSMGNGAIFKAVSKQEVLGRMALTLAATHDRT